MDGWVRIHSTTTAHPIGHTSDGANTSPNHIIDNPNLPPLTPTLPDQEREVTYHSDVGYATSVDLGMLRELEDGQSRRGITFS